MVIKFYKQWYELCQRVDATPGRWLIQIAVWFLLFCFWIMILQKKVHLVKYQSMKLAFYWVTWGSNRNLYLVGTSWWFYGPKEEQKNSVLIKSALESLLSDRGFLSQCFAIRKGSPMPFWIVSILLALEKKVEAE